MKILVYYIDFVSRPGDQVNERIEAKKAELIKELGTAYKIMVLPCYIRTGDRVEVLDLSYNVGIPPAYTPYTAAPTYTPYTITSLTTGTQSANVNYGNLPRNS